MATYRLELFKKDSTTADLKITSTSATQNYQIARVEYEKKLFAPCYAEVTITVTDSEKNNNLPDIAEFTGADSAKLYVCAGNKENLVGEDYIVYQVKPRAANTTKTIVLTLYSRDKLLTLDKFCHVYLNKRLGADIITGMLKSGGQLASCGVKYTVNTARLQLTEITISVPKEGGKPGEMTDMQVELIQPYRVQYNEDFYSFISRTACACGEFLFFEDGKLQLGVSTADKYKIANDTASVIKVEKSSCKSSGLTIRSYYNDYRYKQDKKPESIGEKELTGDEDAAFDEYFDVYDRKDLPDTLKRETPTPKPYFKFFQDALCSKLGVAIGAPNTFTITSIITSILYNVAQELGANAANRDYMNGQFKKNVFDSKTTNSPGFIPTQQEKDDKLSQFSDLDSGGKILHRFFSEVRKREQQADLDKLTLQVKTDKVYVKLGSLVTFGETEYAVTRICGKYNPGVAATTDVTDVTDVPDVTEIDLVPKCDVTIFTYSSATNTYKQLDPVARYVPPYSKCPELPAAQPQVAIVADVDDPRYMGRVRIRYPWQYKKDVSSPWIRILSPLASKKKNIHFEPAVNDEVMVGYIGGNIDRPYVAGSLFNKDTPIHGSLYLANSSTIKIGSQRLDFKGGTYDEWINDFIPGWGTVIQFLPGFSDKMSDFGDGKPVLDNLKGNTTLTDAYGFWTIKGDTAGRSVTIDSLWGKVSINAFTGINIVSAGDIKIKGKNIDILASNNVNIQSGLAIKNERDAAKFEKMNGGLSFLGAVAGQLTDILFGRVDMSLLRTIRELWAPPKEGTLKVKSYRNLLLEAGDGAAFYESKYHKNFTIDKQAKTDKVTDYKKLLEGLIGIRTKVMDYCTTILYGVRGELKTSSDALQEKITNYLTDFKNEANLPLKTITLEKYLEHINAAVYNNFETDETKALDGFRTQLVENKVDNNKVKVVDDLLGAINKFKTFKGADYGSNFLPKCVSFNKDLSYITDENQAIDFNNTLTENCKNFMDKHAKFSGYKWFYFDHIMTRGMDKLLRPMYFKLIKDNADFQSAFSSFNGNVGIDTKRSDWEAAVKKMGSSAGAWDVFSSLKNAGKEYASVIKTNYEYNWKPEQSGRIMMSHVQGISHTLDMQGHLVTSNISENNDDLLLAIQRVLLNNDNWHME